MKVKIDILFSRNCKIGSRLISWASSKTAPLYPTPSHVAILVNSKWVFQSTLEKNVHIISYKEWLTINEQLYQIDIQEDHEFSQIKALFRSLEGKKYDWGGIAYYSIRWALNQGFGLRMPKTNIFQSKDKYFCCEVAGMLLKQDFSMDNPADVYFKLINN
jgi:hypothetical protein